MKRYASVIINNINGTGVNMSDNRPIAVFDSGVGGISILRELIKQMPQENYIYYGDAANAPYGSKSHEEIRSATLMHSEELLKLGSKAIVVACNTATSVAIDELRAKYPDVPIIGVEPALKPAVMYKANSVIVVMATPATLSESKFAALMDKYGKASRIIPLPCHQLAKIIESGTLEGQILDDYIASLFAPYSDIHIDSIVLGCTHYPFVKKSILKAFDHTVKLFDGACGTAKETRRRLAEKNMLSTRTDNGSIEILTSADINTFGALAKKLLAADI